MDIPTQICQQGMGPSVRRARNNLADVCIHIGRVLVVLALQAALDAPEIHGAAHKAAVARRVSV